MEREQLRAAILAPVIRSACGRSSDQHSPGSTVDLETVTLAVERKRALVLARNHVVCVVPFLTADAVGMREEILRVLRRERSLRAGTRDEVVRRCRRRQGLAQTHDFQHRGRNHQRFHAADYVLSGVTAPTD